MSKSWGGTLGKFGQYCKKREIDREKLAKAIGVTPSYISMFAHEKATPGREAAVNIELWTEQEFGVKSAFRCRDWPRESRTFERAA